MSSPPASLAETMPATSPPAPVGGMGFNFLPSLPIISKIFGFLTSLHMRSVGFELSDVRPEYGWDLVLFEQTVEQTGSGGVVESSEALTVSESVLESCEVQSGSDIVFEPSGVLSGVEDSPGPVFNSVSGLGETGTGPEPIPDLGEARTEPSLIFEESLDDPFDNLDQIADIDKDEGSDTLIKIVQTKPVQILQTGEGQRRRRFKTLAGRTDLLLVHKFRSL